MYLNRNFHQNWCTFNFFYIHLTRYISSQKINSKKMMESMKISKLSTWEEYRPQGIVHLKEPMSHHLPCTSVPQRNKKKLDGIYVNPQVLDLRMEYTSG